MLDGPDANIGHISDVIFENVHSLDQPTPTQSGIVKIEVLEDHSLFIRITERNGDLVGDTLIMSTYLE